MLEVMWSSLPNKAGRQEELALFERMPDLNPVSQPIPLPSRPKRESVYTKVCTLRRQSSSPASSSHMNPPPGSFDQEESQEDDEDWDDAFIAATADDGASDLPAQEPAEVFVKEEVAPKDEDKDAEEETPLLQDFEVVGTCEEAKESSAKQQLAIPSQHATNGLPQSAGIRPSLPPPEILGCGNPFLIFLCLTVLLQHRDFVMSRSLDSTSLAMHFDRLVRKHNVERVLSQARTLYYRFDTSWTFVAISCVCLL